MWNSKKMTVKSWISFLLMCFLIIGGFTYYVLFHTPKDSLELYQGISFAEDFNDAQKLMLDGYEGNFTEADFDFINSLENSANSVSQVTLFEYDDKTFVIMTSPGTDRLKVLKVEEAPEEIRDYFFEFLP
ncbi:hypothetical protein [Planococcus beigongshangi]|uniref:hypothetical protein n=1 Tax=Planococcus beigongshangi TaxID=2782536 RepID=UPI00193BEE96|nr:hypothetical protein [Planococcus beigongshangi]